MKDFMRGLTAGIQSTQNGNSGLITGMTSGYNAVKDNSAYQKGIEQIQGGDWESGVNTIAERNPEVALGLAQYKQKQDDAMNMAQMKIAADIQNRNTLTPYQQEMLALKRQEMAQGQSNPFNSKNEFINLMGIRNNPQVWDSLPDDQKALVNARLNYMSNNPENIYEVSQQKALGKAMGEFSGEREKEQQIGYYREGGQKYIMPGTEAEEDYLTKNSKKITNNETVARTAKTVVDDIQAVKRLAGEHPELAASWGSKLGFIPGTPAANIKARIESIKGNSGVDSLLKIKASGAGLGQIPQSQMDMLSNLIGNLDQAQSFPELLDVINRYERIYTDVYNNAISDNQKIKSKIRQPIGNNTQQTETTQADYKSKYGLE